MLVKALLQAKEESTIRELFFQMRELAVSGNTKEGTLPSTRVHCSYSESLVSLERRSCRVVSWQIRLSLCDYKPLPRCHC